MKRCWQFRQQFIRVEWNHNDLFWCCSVPIILEVTSKKSVPEERKIQPGCVSISRTKILLADQLISGDNSALLGLKKSHRHCQTHVGITSLHRTQGVTPEIIHLLWSAWNISSSWSLRNSRVQILHVLIKSCCLSFYSEWTTALPLLGEKCFPVVVPDNWEWLHLHQFLHSIISL